MRSREDFAWAAGFYEGEGWVVSTNRHQRYPILGISQKELEPLLRFQEALSLGGHQSRHLTSGMHRTGINTFRLSGFVKVQAAVAMMWPWLCQRRRGQIRKVLLAYQQAWLMGAWTCPRGHEKYLTARGRRRCRSCEIAAIESNRERGRLYRRLRRQKDPDGINRYHREWARKRRAAQRQQQLLELTG